jgi:preprotein translocase subunit YajC
MIQQPEETGISLHVGDSVRTEAGLRGKVITLNNDGVTVYIQIEDRGLETHVGLYRLDTLTKIDTEPA